MTLTEADLNYARMLRVTNALADIDSANMDLSTGVIAVMCCDGHQMEDRHEYLTAMLKANGSPSVIHKITRHGGALRLAENSPLNKRGRTTDADLLDEIAEAAEMKNIGTVLLEAHAPCGMAAMHHLSLKAVVELLFAGKMRARAEMPDLTFATILHMDWGGGQKRYYHLSRSRMQQVAAS
jgi:hypothetical protein